MIITDSTCSKFTPSRGGNTFLRGRGIRFRCQRKFAGRGRRTENRGEIEKLETSERKEREKSTATLTPSGEVRPFVSRAQTSFCNCKFSTLAPAAGRDTERRRRFLAEVKYCGLGVETSRCNAFTRDFRILSHASVHLLDLYTNLWRFICNKLPTLVCSEMCHGVSSYLSLGMRVLRG